MRSERRVHRSREMYSRGLPFVRVFFSAAVELVVVAAKVNAPAGEHLARPMDAPFTRAKHAPSSSEMH